jgi:hypothetical protein
MSAPIDAVQPVAPPPQSMPLVQKVAAILLAGYTLKKTTDALLALLAPYGVSRKAVQAALSLAKTAHKPHALITRGGLAPSRAASAPAQISRKAAATDVYYRAAYVIKASNRMQKSLDNGDTIGAALAKESVWFDAHRQARHKRLDAAAKVARATIVHGPLLGWYRNIELDSDIDCRVADGNNFYATEGTVIGMPGSVHPRCGCEAGPPHPTGGMVNDVLGDTLGRMAPSSATKDVLHLKRKSA